MPFASQAQQRFAFGTHQPWAERWARETDFSKLPKRVRVKLRQARQKDVSAAPAAAGYAHGPGGLASAPGLGGKREKAWSEAARAAALEARRRNAKRRAVDRGRAAGTSSSSGGRTASGRRGSGRSGRAGRSPIEASIDKLQRAAERQAARADNRAATLRRLNIAPDGQQALEALRGGQQPDPAALARGGFIDAGLVEQARDGSYRLTASGRAALSAADAGDLGRAGDTISAARDRATAREQRRQAAADRKRAAEQKKLAAAQRRAELAKRRTASGGRASTSDPAAAETGPEANSGDAQQVLVDRLRGLLEQARARQARATEQAARRGRGRSWARVIMPSGRRRQRAQKEADMEGLTVAEQLAVLKAHMMSRDEEKAMFANLAKSGKLRRGKKPKGGGAAAAAAGPSKDAKANEGKDRAQSVAHPKEPPTGITPQKPAAHDPHAPTQADRAVADRVRSLSERKNELTSQMTRLRREHEALNPSWGQKLQPKYQREREAKQAQIQSEIDKLASERNRVQEQSQTLLQHEEGRAALDRVTRQEILARQRAGTPMPGDDVTLRMIEEKHGIRTPEPTAHASAAPVTLNHDRARAAFTEYQSRSQEARGLRRQALQAEVDADRMEASNPNLARQLRLSAAEHKWRAHGLETGPRSMDLLKEIEESGYRLNSTGRGITPTRASTTPRAGFNPSGYKGDEPDPPVRIKAAIEGDLLAMGNRQVTRERFAEASYTAISTWADVQGYGGLQAWAAAAAAEERAHAQKQIDYLNKRAAVILEPVPAPQANFAGYADALQTALALEKIVTAAITGLARQARAAGDLATAVFYETFLPEQIDAENELTIYVQKVARGAPIDLLDAELFEGAA